jgi:predicted DNA-binding transcriptional regulator AlpA
LSANNTNTDYKIKTTQYSDGRELIGSLTLFNKLIWGIDEVCSFTSYAKGTIYNLVSRGEIPFRKRKGGKRLVFIPSEIIEWFKGGTYA